MQFKEYLRVRLSGERFPQHKSRFISGIIFFVFGLGAAVWVLVRLLPKPSRATYPCMKVAFPVASSFVIYLGGLVGSVYLFNRARTGLKGRRFLLSASFVLAALLSLSLGLLNDKNGANATTLTATQFSDPLGPNSPIGEAKGVMPGRVVWVHNPDATNENCTNSSQSDAYWLSKNCNQAAVDGMFSAAIKQLTHKATEPEAWDAVFRYFNNQHGKGDVGYNTEETIFIKVNAVTAYGGATSNGGKQPASVAIEYDTTPQAILAMLRQLINVAGVPQNKIYVGDPIADLWDHMYQYFYAEFPNVNYVTRRGIKNRYWLKASTTPGIYYSDKGTVMNLVTSHRFYKEMMDANYLINIPVMKGHRWGGVTFFAKNHFGSNTTDGSWQLHKGLMDGNDNYDEAGRRYDYRMYRVFVDLMGSKYLGGNTLIYFMDALFPTSHEHQKPQKFLSAPFNNDWCSSIMLSLDPVAIESVCLDIMQKEFTKEDLKANPPRYTYVQWAGIDDYLHQAASSDWWPEGIAYDPDNSGTPLKSLGVHEHWNNADDMKYSRNLGSGNGIELIMVEQIKTGMEQLQKGIAASLCIYPNPVKGIATVRLNSGLQEEALATIYSTDGRKVSTIAIERISAIGGSQVDLSSLEKGNYTMQLSIRDKVFSTRFSKQ